MAKQESDVCCMICGGKIKKRLVIRGYFPKGWEKIHLKTQGAFPTTEVQAAKFWGKGEFVKMRIEYQELK